MRESVADTAGRSAVPLVVSLLVVSLATKRWIYGLLAAGVGRAIFGGTRAELGQRRSRLTPMPLVVFHVKRCGSFGP